MKLPICLAALLAVLPGFCSLPALAEQSAEALPAAVAVARAADPAHAGVQGVFAFEVKGSGKQRRAHFLNSMADYRDPGCLTIAFGRGLAAAFSRKFGGDVSSLEGRRIAVRGVPQQVRVWFYDNQGRRTRDYYHQTHITIRSVDQIWLVDE
jgi:hypothetical protein